MDEEDQKFFKISRKATFISGLLLVVLAIVGATWYFRLYQPTSDWYNRATITIKVKEGETYAVESATISVRGASYTTDSNGKVTISNGLKGDNALVISKAGFVTKTQNLVLRRGENDLAYISLQKEPEQLFAVKGFVQDYVSGAPLIDVQVVLGNSSLKTDPSGAYFFEKVAPGSLKLFLSKDGYSSKEMIIELRHTDQITAKVPLVPTGTALFVSNRDGKRNLYTAQYDGSDQKLFLQQPGEGENHAPSTSPNRNYIAFSSTRDKVKSSYGASLSKLYVVGADGKEAKKISDDLSPSFSPIWSADSNYLYFSGFTSPQNDQLTYRIYSLISGKTMDLPDSVYSPTFSESNDVFAYYTTGVETAEDGTDRYTNILKVVTLKNGDKREIAKKDKTFTDLRFSQNNTSISYSTVVDNSARRFRVNLSDLGEVEVPEDPLSKRIFRTSGDGTVKLFTEERDGKRDLFAVDSTGEHEKKLSNSGSVDQDSVQWTKNSLYALYSMKKSEEQALYIVSKSGGDPKKIADIFVTGSSP